MEEFLKFTVITPSYNQGRFIEQTIQSVLAQNYPNLEYWVMDGGSTDNTLSILKKYGDKLEWISEKDAGQGDAVNKGLQRATGDIIAWINSDDTYTPDAFRNVARYFVLHPEKMLVYGNADSIDEQGFNIGSTYVEWQETEAAYREKIGRACMLSQPAVFFRKSVVDRIGLLEPDIHTCMDYDYWLRAFLKLSYKSFGYLDHTLANTRRYPETKTQGKPRILLRETIGVVQKNLGYVDLDWTSGYAITLVDKQYPYYDYHPDRRGRMMLLKKGVAYALFFWFNLGTPQGRGKIRETFQRQRTPCL